MKAQLNVVVEEYRSRLQREEERGERDTVSIYEGVIPSSLRYCTYLYLCCSAILGNHPTRVRLDHHRIKHKSSIVTVSSQTSVLRAAAGFSLVNLSFESADLELEVEDESSHAKHRGHHVTLKSFVSKRPSQRCTSHHQERLRRYPSLPLGST